MIAPADLTQLPGRSNPIYLEGKLLPLTVAQARELDLRDGQVVQALVPEARVVKAFSIYGFENFADPSHPGHSVRPALLYCGADPAAKATVGALIDALGFQPVDVGGLEQDADRGVERAAGPSDLLVVGDG